MSEEIGISSFGIPACTFSKDCPNGPCSEKCYGRKERSDAKYKELEDAK